MSKHNILYQKIKKQFLSINDLIESYFNSLRQFIQNFKKSKFSTNNKLFFVFGVTLILILIYFLIPTFYNKNLIQLEIKNQIFKKYKIEIKFNDEIKYGLLPKPHFVAKNLSIIRSDREIGNSKNVKMFISIDKFFSTNKFNLKNLIFKNTDFMVYKKDLSFFKDLMKTEPNENKIIFKKSNIFFKDSNDEILFINKINKSEFYYNFKNLENILVSKNEIFNIPFKLIVKNDKFNKEVNTKFDSSKIRLNIENKIDYENINKLGFLDVLFVNKNTSLKYIIKKNTLTFNSENTGNSYNGHVDFKPFYLFANFDYKELSTKKLFNENSILIDLIKTDILKSENLNAKIDFNVNNITNNNELNNLNLKLNIDQGDISFSGSTIMWKDACKIFLSESLLSYDGEEIDLIGKFIFNFNDINNLYSTFQINKSNRKEIKKIEIDFVYNFNKKKITFDNVKVDNTSNINLQNFLDEFNTKNKKIFNKITFKNFINNFFSNYEG